MKKVIFVLTVVLITTVGAYAAPPGNVNNMTNKEKSVVFTTAPQYAAKEMTPVDVPDIAGSMNATNNFEKAEKSHAALKAQDTRMIPKAGGTTGYDQENHTPNHNASTGGLKPCEKFSMIAIAMSQATKEENPNPITKQKCTCPMCTEGNKA